MEGKGFDKLFEEFKEHCRDSTQYNLTSLDDIMAEFNRWLRNKGYNKIVGTTKEEEAKIASEIDRIMVIDDDAAKARI